ncbi:redox-active disulfide protein 2 [Psychroflexus sp. MES1-P1E]|uniref:redox-active disulfide protein 2 n=1 Tax=Psychroflexus sp. MES1-P1E TaxID=2058320 RepID=UPI000C7C9061|nr:redox-active disulfide protein 2 [Psychroflexus sp. MES1-P1E]PKG43841.1 redox-active disulfide protein 2 [Psychroflexus sp. MES1-P1E]
MKQKKLSSMSYEELKKKHTAIKTLTWMLAIVLLGSLVFFIFISMQSKFTPLVIIPIALSTILPINFINLKKFKTEMELRKSKPDNKI